jgi:hypothetical protein
MSTTVFEVLDRSPELLYFFEHPATYDVRWKYVEFAFPTQFEMENFDSNSVFIQEGKTDHAVTNTIVNIYKS